MQPNVHPFTTEQTKAFAQVGQDAAGASMADLHQIYMRHALHAFHVVLNAHQLKQLSATGSHAQCASSVEEFVRDLAVRSASGVEGGKQARVESVLRRAVTEVAKIYESGKA